jgi:hypothetical protein
MHETPNVEVERADASTSKLAIIAMVIIIAAALIGGPAALTLYLAQS